MLPASIAFLKGKMASVGMLRSVLLTHGRQSILGSVTGTQMGSSALAMAPGLRMATNWKETYPVRQLLGRLLLGGGWWVEHSGSPVRVVTELNQCFPQCTFFPGYRTYQIGS